MHGSTTSWHACWNTLGRPKSLGAPNHSQFRTVEIAPIEHIRVTYDTSHFLRDAVLGEQQMPVGADSHDENKFLWGRDPANIRRAKTGLAHRRPPFLTHE